MDQQTVQKSKPENSLPKESISKIRAQNKTDAKEKMHNKISPDSIPQPSKEKWKDLSEMTNEEKEEYLKKYMPK